MAKIPVTDARRIKAIRQLTGRVRNGRAGEFLDRIAEIALRKGDIASVFKGKDPKPTETKSTRNETGGRNRKDSGGNDRGGK